MKIALMATVLILLAGCSSSPAQAHVSDEALKACYTSVATLLDHSAPAEDYAQAAVIVAFGCQKDAETEPAIFQKRYGN